MEEKRGIPANQQQRNFSGQANYPNISRASYPPLRRPPLYRAYPQPPVKTEPPSYPKAYPQQPNKNVPVKGKKNKLVFIILIIIIALVGLGIIFSVIYLFSRDSGGGKDRELSTGDFIDKAVVRDEKTAYITLKSGISSNRIANITLIFRSKDSEYTYFSEYIGSTYSISASNLGLESFEDIISVDAIIAFATSITNPPVNPDLPPKDPNAGKCSINCSSYYSTGKCGVLLSNGCNNTLNCSSCNKGFYCYMGEGVKNVCISNLISCRDSDGRDYYQKGSVTINNSGAFLFKEDSCSGELQEYYCYFNGSRFEAKIDSKDCEYGCSAGKCKIPSCESDSNCSGLGGVCGIAKCNLTLQECYVSYNLSTTLCRNNVSECDEKDFCSGDNVGCSDSNKTDGSVCSTGVCKSGKCKADERLVSYWNLNGNAQDSVGTNHGTVNGAVLSQGASGQAYSFDGIDDYIEIGNSESLNLTSKFTISAWVYLKPQATTYPGIFWKNDTIILRYCPAELSIVNDFQGFVRIGTILEPRVQFGPYPDYNKWYHVAMTYDSTKSENNLELYMNGELKSQENRTGRVDDLPGNYYIGRYYSVPSNYFNGTIDEVKVWNYALSREAIKSEYDLVTPPGECTNDTGCTSVGSFCDASTSIPYTCSKGADGCLDRTNKAACATGEVCSSGTCVPSQPPKKSIYHWKFDGNAQDSVGTNHGTVNGATLVTGVSGQAYRFDGANDYISTAEQDKLDSSQNGTIAAWIKCEADCPIGAIVSYATKSQTSSNFLVRVRDNALEAAWNSKPDASWVTINSSTKINDGQWHHAAFAADGISKMKIYLDGVEQTTIFDKDSGLGNESDWIGDITGLPTAGHHISIGVLDRDTPTNWFKGDIDEVMVWNYSLSAQEISYVYNSQKAAMPSLPAGPSSIFSKIWNFITNLFN